MAMLDELQRRALAAVTEAAPRAAADPARPVYHFLPPAQWMNDVHGAFHDRGWYHVFSASSKPSSAGARGRIDTLGEKDPPDGAALRSIPLRPGAPELPPKASGTSMNR